MDPFDSKMEYSVSNADSQNEGFSDRGSESEESETNSIYDNNPSLRNARNFALMAEERWIIEMLKSIRKQRNALKVESLYYQGLKANLYAQHAKEFGENSIEAYEIQPNNEIELPIPEPTHPDLSPNLDECFAPNGPLTSKHEDILMKMQQLERKDTQNPSNVEDFSLLEGQCNSEELQNLVFHQQKKPDTWDIGDPEYESDDEEWSRVNIDMSMLVGGSDQEDDD